MNKQLEDFARKTIKEGLAKCPEDWQVIFKRMYAHGDLEKDINQVVDDMEADKLDWALQQVENSLKKLATPQEQI